MKLFAVTSVWHWEKIFFPNELSFPKGLNIPGALSYKNWAYPHHHKKSSCPCSRDRWSILTDCFFQACAFALLHKWSPCYERCLCWAPFVSAYSHSWV